jgi:hypothetical protein
MSTIHARYALAIIGLSLVTIFARLMLRILPAELALGLLVWFIASLPIGIAVGHCVLTENSARNSRTRRGQTYST